LARRHKNPKVKKSQLMPSSYLTHSYQCHDLVKDEPQLSYQGSKCITYRVNTPTSPHTTYVDGRWVSIIGKVGGNVSGKQLRHRMATR
jgi:hypothetical protein